MSQYQAHRDAGISHEQAILLDSKTIIEDELKHPISELSPSELHSIIANARQDVSGIALLLAGISSRLRAFQWLLLAIIALLLVIAIRM